MEAASATLTPVVLELGGKDAFVVCDDADMKQASSASCFISPAHTCAFRHLGFAGLNASGCSTRSYQLPSAAHSSLVAKTAQEPRGS